MLPLLVCLVCLLALPLLLGQTTDNVKDNRKAGERMTLKINDVEYAFRWCPAGAFMMGSPVGEKDRNDNETLHRVTLSKGFWMLETEVTQLMWLSVMGTEPSHFKGDQRPVESVSWDDCQEYVKKLNELLAGTHLAGTPVAPAGFKFSLPTEAQWEYACRADTTTIYSFGDTLSQKQANFDGGQTKDVGSYPANAWGLKDMHGNVCEWCLDSYGDYPNGAVTDPVSLQQGSSRVIRGGGWSPYAEDCRSAYRDSYDPSRRYYDIGLRLSLVSDK
jgi:formylglycine-generating enzyme required for sulfatase activity